jgi:hypothetical protein
LVALSHARFVETLADGATPGGSAIRNFRRNVVVANV